MQKLDISIEEDVKEYITKVAALCEGYDVYLVGGYLRDKYVYPNATAETHWWWSSKKASNKLPKDVDIVLVPTTIGVLPEIPLEVAEGSFVMYSKDASDISDMEERGVKKLIGLRNTKLSTKEVQLIVYQNPMSMESVVLDMDMNIVQVGWCPLTDVVKASDAFVSGHADKTIECLHSYDEERTFARYERMEKKFSDYKSVGKPDIVLSRKDRKRIRAGNSNSV